MLINIDVLVSEEIIMNLLRKVIIVDSCKNTEIFLIIMIKSTNQINHIILTKQCTVILSQSNLAVTVFQLNLFHNHNFLFKLNCRHTNIFVYVHIVDHIMTEVYVCNNGNVFLIISHKFRMNQIVEYKVKNCYQIIINDTVLVSSSRQFINQFKEWIQTAMWSVLTAVIVFHISIEESSSSEHKLFNDIMIYEFTCNIITQIEIIINNHAHLWKDHSNMIDLSENE